MSYFSFAAECQDFRGFYSTSRVRKDAMVFFHYMLQSIEVVCPQYWRMVVADNYGDPTATCLAEVQFFGVGECDLLCFCNIH